MTLENLKQALQAQANPERARVSAWFFKTGPGQYGEGDVFIGLRVPRQRKIARQFKDLALNEIKKLLDDKIHEYRLTALLILVGQFAKASEAQRKVIYDFYLKNACQVNNWDLVDSSAPYIVGVYLLDKPRAILNKLAKSNNLWERRIAILATFTFIKAGEFKDTIKIAELLLNDSHDLIHKAVGWMLREMGKKDQDVLLRFLDKHYKKMPRVMLRYAVEKLLLKKRQFYLGK